MSPSIFISYSRRNQYLARRLALDLQRCGCRPWMDVSDIPPGNRWRDELRQAIDHSEYLFLLWSPEADQSVEVLKEFEYARKQTPAKRLWILRLSASTGEMRPEYRDLHYIDFTAGYWQRMEELVKKLGLPRPPRFSPWEWVGSSRLAADARREFRSADNRDWTVHGGPDLPSQAFAPLPLSPSAYAMSWLVTPADGTLATPGRMQVLLNFTGNLERRTVDQVLEFLVRNKVEPHLLLIEGPRRGTAYDLPNDAEHIWRDCVELSHRMLERCCGERPLSFFLHAPQALVFPLAARLLVRSKFEVFHWNPQSSAPESMYSRVYSS
ncbi:MAG: toll/interleukin-1 receptor domain-containing protein [Pirellulaceae bacterium]|nr:toll/interleukin-1 receptor domain-containing protein [Pirellulaceae bacterium]